ncbi:MAG: hypothetical protein CM1200mP29_03900 [Verrucomicrobiota bacterium]|nr:MAG: hypothetical protein CM1200mP29_03900 [Verrucomicrobiota bacterium]
MMLTSSHPLRRGLVFEEPNVLLVDVHVHEAAYLPVLTERRPLMPGNLPSSSSLLADCCGLDLDGFLFVGELPQRSGDSDFTAM